MVFAPLVADPRFSEIWVINCSFEIIVLQRIAYIMHLMAAGTKIVCCAAAKTITTNDNLTVHFCSRDVVSLESQGVAEAMLNYATGAIAGARFADGGHGHPDGQ